MGGFTSKLGKESSGSRRRGWASGSPPRTWSPTPPDPWRPRTLCRAGGTTLRPATPARQPAKTRWRWRCQTRSWRKSAFRQPGREKPRKLWELSSAPISFAGCHISFTPWWSQRVRRVSTPSYSTFSPGLDTWTRSSTRSFTQCPTRTSRRLSTNSSAFTPAQERIKCNLWPKLFLMAFKS